VTFDVVFALDDSSNVPASDWSEMLSLVNGFIDNIAVGFGNARIAVVRYSDDATIAFNLDAYRSNDLVKNAVSALTHSTTGSSQRNLAHAFQVTLTNLLITGERYFAAKVRASFWPVAVTATMPDCDSRCCSTVIRRRTAAGIEVECNPRRGSLYDNSVLCNTIRCDTVFYLIARSRNRYHGNSRNHIGA